MEASKDVNRAADHWIFVTWLAACAGQLCAAGVVMMGCGDVFGIPWLFNVGAGLTIYGAACLANVTLTPLLCCLRPPLWPPDA